MATLYLAIHLFGLVLGFPISGHMTAQECATASEQFPALLVCVPING